MESEASEPEAGTERPPFALKSALIVLLVLAAVLGLAVELCQRLAQEQRYLARVEPRIVGLPEHSSLAELITSSLEEDAALSSNISIFAPDLTLSVRQRFESNPWIERVFSVRRRFPERVEVQVSVKSPLCAAERDGVYLLVDANGRILPGEYDSPLPGRPLVTIRPVDGTSPSLRGLNDEWFVRAVAEGAAVVADLDAHWGQMPYSGWVEILQVDVSNFDGRLNRARPDVSLATNQNWLDPARQNAPFPVVLYWGRSTRHEAAILELPVPRKLSALARLIDRAGSLHDMRIIDVRFDRLVWRNSRDQHDDLSMGH